MSKKLYIGNLALTATEQILKEMFSRCGLVTNVKIPVDYRGRGQGFAFVEMSTVEAAAGAIAKFHGESYEGLALAVTVAKTTAARDFRRDLANKRNRGRNKP